MTTLGLFLGLVLGCAFVALGPCTLVYGYLTGHVGPFAAGLAATVIVTLVWVIFVAVVVFGFFFGDET